MAANLVGAKTLQKIWEGCCWEGVWIFLNPWDVEVLGTTTSVWNVLGKYGSHGELFFFFMKKEPFVLTTAVEFRPCVTAETLKACALNGLLMIAEDSTSSTLNGLSPELKMWRNGGLRNPFWESVEGGWTESKCTPHDEVVRTHNVESRAVEVAGQDWSSEVVSLFH